MTHLIPTSPRTRPPNHYTPQKSGASPRVLRVKLRAPSERKGKSDENNNEAAEAGAAVVDDHSAERQTSSPGSGSGSGGNNSADTATTVTSPSSPTAMDVDDDGAPPEMSSSHTQSGVGGGRADPVCNGGSGVGVSEAAAGVSPRLPGFSKEAGSAGSDGGVADTHAADTAATAMEEDEEGGGDDAAGTYPFGGCRFGEAGGRERDE